MARKQNVKSILINADNNLQNISPTELLVTSFIIQCPIANTDFVVVGGDDGQIFEIAPGKDLSINGDGLDHGTFAYINLQEVFVRALSGNQIAHITYLQNF